MRLEHQIEVINKLGLHARAAAKLVNTAAEFSSDIHLFYKEQDADAKSIMGLMMLAAANGAQLRLVAEGDDAEQAIAVISRLFAERFGEEE